MSLICTHCLSWCRVFVSAIATIVVAQPPDSKFEPPPELPAGFRMEFKSQVRTDKYDDLEDKWKSACDPKNNLPLPLKQACWKSTIAIEVRGLSGGLSVGSRVDRIGLAVNSVTLNQSKQVFAEFHKKFVSMLQKKTVGEICEALPEIAEELKGGVTAEKEKQLGWFVQFREQPIVGEKSQNWMLVEIAPVPVEWPIYPSAILHRLLCRGTQRLTLLEPHPRTELREQSVKQYLNTPLQANRPFVLDKYNPPLPEIPDDGLDNTKRELALNFSLIDDIGGNSYQFESIGYSATSKFGQGMLDVLYRRIPPGKVLTYDELHKICGELCSSHRKWLRSDNRPFIFVISRHEHGRFSYARLNVEILSQSNKE